jgi:hypothetical protein
MHRLLSRTLPLLGAALVILAPRVARGETLSLRAIEFNVRPVTIRLQNATSGSVTVRTPGYFQALKTLKQPGDSVSLDFMECYLEFKRDSNPIKAVQGYQMDLVFQPEQGPAYILHVASEGTGLNAIGGWSAPPDAKAKLVPENKFSGDTKKGGSGKTFLDLHFPGGE